MTARPENNTDYEWQIELLKESTHVYNIPYMSLQPSKLKALPNKAVYPHRHSIKIHLVTS